MFEAPQGTQTYSTGSLNFTNLLLQCGTETTLDRNSLIALYDGNFVPISFSDLENQDSLSVFFRSDKGPGDYYIYFASGSGRAKTSYFQQPAYKELQECPNPNADRSCNSIYNYQIPGGSTKLKFTVDISSWSACIPYLPIATIFITNNEKTTILYSTPAEVNVDSAFSTSFVISGRFDAPVHCSWAVVSSNFKVWGFDFQKLENFELENQSIFSIELPEVISQNITLKLKNRGSEGLQDVSLISSIGNLSEEYFSFQPFEEKEILLDISTLESAVYNIDFEVFFDSNGYQNISKKILVYKTFVSDSETNFSISNNTLSSETIYFFNTKVNNTENYTINSDFELCGNKTFEFGVINCTKKTQSNETFYVSRFETQDDVKVNLKNPFNFKIDTFSWQYDDFNKSGEIKNVKAFANFSFSFSKNLEINDENQQQQTYFYDQFYEPPGEPETQETTQLHSDFNILIFSPKENKTYETLFLEAFVDSEHVNCTVSLDDDFVNSTQGKHISQKLETEDGNHSLELDCVNTNYKKTKTINFEVAANQIVSLEEIKTPTALATYDLIPWYISAVILLLSLLFFGIWWYSKKKLLN